MNGLTAHILLSSFKPSPSFFVLFLKKLKSYSCSRVRTVTPSSLCVKLPVWPQPAWEPAHPLFTAPSPVMTIKKDRTSRNSISLSWQEPEHPNGIILDYEVKYYEKVGR